MRNKIIFLLFSIFLLSNLVLAQSSGFDLLKHKSMKIILNIIRFLFTFLMILSSALLIFLGIKYMMAKEKVEEIHRSFIFLILGIVLLITSFFIPNFIKSFVENAIQ